MTFHLWCILPCGIANDILSVKGVDGVLRREVTTGSVEQLQPRLRQTLVLEWTTRAEQLVKHNKHLTLHTDHLTKWIEHIDQRTDHRPNSTYCHI